MKQTPIPEKIEILRIPVSKLDKDLYTCIKTINSLRDVLTEQQKENERLKERIDNQQKEIEINYQNFVAHMMTNHLSKDKPYTAMRSTGEFCECSAGRYKDNNTCAECDKPIKLQEDNYILIQKIVDLLLPPHPTMEDSYKLAHRILAIVKGE